MASDVKGCKKQTERRQYCRLGSDRANNHTSNKGGIKGCGGGGHGKGSIAESEVIEQIITQAAKEASKAVVVVATTELRK